MNFINNQINTAMMKKLLFAGTAVLALSATAVQAETVTNGGVTYSYTLPDNITWTESNNKATATLTTGTDGVSAGYLTVTGTFTTTKTATATVNPTATAVAAASVDFSSWSDNTTFKGNRVQNNNTAVYVGDNVYNLEIQRIIKAGNVTLYTWNDVVTNNDANAIIGYYEDETSGWVDDDGTGTIGETYTKDNTEDFELYYDGTSGFPDYNDLYFSRVATTKTNTNKKTGVTTTTTTVKYYAIYKLVDQTTNNIDSTLTVSFEPTTIPNGVLNADVATLTIGSNITTIDDNAFENATGISYVAASGNYTADNGTYLYTADNKGTLLYVTTNYQSESLELSALTTSVGNYATVGLTSDKIIYYSSTNLSIGSNQGATFISKTPSITWASTSGQIYTAAATSYVNATVLKKTLESLEGSTACVDLRKAKLATDINLTANYGNIMVILPSDQGVSVGGINVIYLDSDGYVCDDLELSDAYRTNGFYTPIAFTATEANYDRVFTSNNSTVCLPFSFTVPNTLTVATMVNSNSEGVIFAEVTETQAGKPYLIFSNSDNATIPTMRNVSVSATTSSNNIGEYEMIGVYEPTTLSAADGNFYGFSSNSLVKITGTATANVKAFRAYLSVEGGSAATMRVSIEAENETNAIEELEATNDDDAAVYNLNGQKINSKAAGFQILSNGTKKIIK